MARQITEIKKSITDVLIADTNIQAIYTLTPGKTFEDEFSAASLESLIFYATAYGIFVHENLFDAHKAEVTGIINNMKPHSLQWYANIAKAYQHGHTLPPDTDKYDNTGLTDEVIAASKIVKQSAVVEVDRGLRIKVATDDGTALGPLDSTQLAAFTSYMSRVKDAGEKLTITSAVADSLKLSLFVKYDPLVLNGSGARLDGNAATSVQDAVKAYLKNLPFNGRLELATLMDEVQKVDGVRAPYVMTAMAKYGALPYTSFTGQAYVPDAGYLKIYDAVNDLTINFEADV